MTTMKKSIIDCKDIKKTYHTGGIDTVVLKGITFHVEEGEFVAIIG